MIPENASFLWGHGYYERNNWGTRTTHRLRLGRFLFAFGYDHKE